MDVMEKTYTLSQKDALALKIWPILITVCCIFLIGAFEASPFSIVFAIFGTGLAWWRNGYVPHTIILKNDDRIKFISFLREIVIDINDIHSVAGPNYRYREYQLRHSKGAIIIPKSMPGVEDLIASIKRQNPNTDVDADTFAR